jgi:hypothetical protein
MGEPIPGVGSTANVGWTLGVQLQLSGVKGSSCPEGAGCPEGPSCQGGPEVVGFLRVGPGVSSVLFLFRWLCMAHSSKMCLSAQQIASSRQSPSKPSQRLRLAPHFHAPQTQPNMANQKTTSSVTGQTSAVPNSFCLVL